MPTARPKSTLLVLGILFVLAFAPAQTRAEDNNTLHLDCTAPTSCFSEGPILSESLSPTFNIRFAGDPDLPSMFDSTTVAIMVPDTLAGFDSLNFFVNMNGTIGAAVNQGFWDANAVSPASAIDNRLLTDFLGLTLNSLFTGNGRNPELGDYLPLVDGATGFQVYTFTVDFWVDNMPVSFCADAACNTAFEFNPGTWFYAYTQASDGSVIDGVPSPSSTILIVPEPGTFSLLGTGLLFGLFFRRRFEASRRQE